MANESYYYYLQKNEIPKSGIMTAAIWGCNLCNGVISGMGGPGGTDKICGECGDKIIDGNVNLIKTVKE